MKKTITTLLCMHLTACLHDAGDGKEIKEVAPRNSQFIGTWVFGPEKFAFFNGVNMTVLGVSTVSISEGTILGNELTLRGQSYNVEDYGLGISLLSYSSEFQETFRLESNPVNTTVNTRFSNSNGSATYKGELPEEPKSIMYQSISYDLDGETQLDLENGCSIYLTEAFPDESLEGGFWMSLSVLIDTSECEGLKEASYVGEIIKLEDGSSKIVATNSESRSGIIIDVQGVDFIL